MPEVPRHSVSVTGIVVRDDGRVLAIMRDDAGRWALPSGILRLDESPAGGVARAVLAAAGVSVTAGQLTGVYKDMRLGVVTLAFRCRVIGGEARFGGEGGQLAWLAVDDADRLMAQAEAARVTDAVSIAGPAVRIHDGSRLL